MQKTTLTLDYLSKELICLILFIRLNCLAKQLIILFEIDEWCQLTAVPLWYTYVSHSYSLWAAKQQASSSLFSDESALFRQGRANHFFFTNGNAHNYLATLMRVRRGGNVSCKKLCFVAWALQYKSENGLLQLMSISCFDFHLFGRAYAKARAKSVS
jgi:hypothetical protein